MTSREGRVPWDVTLSHVLACAESDLGLRSSFGSIVSRLEGASGGASESSTWPTYDRSAIGRIRRVESVLRTMSGRSVLILRVHYSNTPRLPPRVEARLGRLSRVALWLSAPHDASKLVEACQAGSARILGDYRDLAASAVRAAHDEYYAARDS